MAEVPSVAYWIPAYARLGIDGVSIGSNDLTQLMLLTQVGRLDPAACRQRAWRFDAAMMVAGYEAIYARLARAAKGAAA